METNQEIQSRIETTKALLLRAQKERDDVKRDSDGEWEHMKSMRDGLRAQVQVIQTEIDRIESDAPSVKEAMEFMQRYATLNQSSGQLKWVQSGDDEWCCFPGGGSVRVRTSCALIGGAD